MDSQRIAKARPTLQFRPIEAGLSHEEAEIVAMQLKRELQADSRQIHSDDGLTLNL